jgi:soluble lytic murein transglycosylase
MDALKKYGFQMSASLVLIPLMLAGAKTTVTEVSQTANDLPKLNTQGQQGHALELAPSREVASVSSKDLRKEILRTVKSQLPRESQPRAFEIARTVITEANHHMMDPFFLLAVIKTESHFNMKARGRHGEIGLMQILPQTAKWLAPQAGMDPEKINLEDPKTNIRIGATYFASPRKSFSGFGSRYIGAYNMGAANVRKLVSMNVEPSAYPDKVLKNYRGFYKSMTKTTKSTSALQTRAVSGKSRSLGRTSSQAPMPGWFTT